MFMAESLYRPGRMPSSPPSNPISNFGSILARLNAVIGEETTMLSQRKTGELQSFTVRKNQLLFELTRAMKAAPADELQRAYGPQLKELRWRLDANKKLLGTHLDAAKEVSQTIIETIRQADSDGTYTASRKLSFPLK